MSKKLRASGFTTILLFSIYASFTPFFNSSSDVSKDNLLTSTNKTLDLNNDDLQVVEKVNKFFKYPASEKKKKVKGVLAKDSPNLFAQWHNDIRTMPGKDKPDYEINYQIKELLKAKHIQNTNALSKSSTTNSLPWNELGPGNVSGRTRSILIHPTDIDTWYVGSVGGGVWKTTDAGQNWILLTESIPNLATSALAWSESNPDIIYVGTGEGFGSVDQIDGSGMWKSTDAGVTWEQLPSTVTNPEFENVMRLTVDPADPNIVVVAVAPGFNYLPETSSGIYQPSSGIYRSTDGGVNWIKTYNAGSNVNVEDLRSNPLNFKTQYATINSTTVIKSLDGGQTWFESASGIGPVGRMEIAIAPSDTNRIYISAQGGSSGSILYSSIDGGANWFGHSDGSGDVHWLGGQGWYDNTIAVNPYDEDQVFVGGPQLWQIDVSGTIDTSDLQVTGVERDNIESFLTFVNWGGSYGGGGIDLGEAFHTLETGLTSSDFASVEIRFGPGKTQKAHSFEWAPAWQLQYLDYIDVPFEVWDVDNNKQLMVSIRDNDVSGTWNPTTRAEGLSREYIFIHAIDYDEASADTNIAKVAGMAYKNTYAIWPEVPAGGTFDPDAFPESKIVINWGTFLTKGLTTTNIADAYTSGAASKGIHVDHHNLIMVKTDTATKSYRLLNGNDGGIAFSDDKGATFSQTGEVGRNYDPGDTPNEVLLGYNTTQFYGIDKANGVRRYVGGMQDNGSWVSPENPDENSSWEDAPSGDGYEASWHYNDLNKIIETSQYNGIYRTLNGGNNWNYIAGSIDNGSGNAPFFTKIGKSKQDPDLIFAIGSSGVWRSDNFGTSWTLTDMPQGFTGTSSFSQIKISLNNPQIVWTATYMLDGFRPMVSVDGGLSFNTTNIFTDVTLGRISGLETHPFEDSTAFVVLSMRGTPKVLKTTDLGQTWVELSGFGSAATSSNGFPDVSVYSLLVMPYNTDIIWAGTEIGIFESTDGGANWSYSDNGFPPVAVYDMVIVNDEIVVATHGRGAWSVSVPELDNYNPASALLPPRFTQELGGGAGGFVQASIKLPISYDSTLIFVNDERFQKIAANSSSKDTTFKMNILITEVDTVILSLKSYIDEKTLKSSSNQIIVYPISEAVSSYSENFNEETTDFNLNGFTIAQVEGFTDGAIHSTHPYPNSETLSFILTVPIIVAETDATVSFKEIAIVEPGDDGVVFGQYGFWDFAIVEASNDNGITWLALSDGYDANSYAEWLTAYNNKNDPVDSTLFKARTLNLLDKFSAGDKVILRFRLFADDSENTWGWAIDDLSIQDGIVSVDDVNNLPLTYNLQQNYPNPFNPSTTIKFSIPADNRVVLKIYDILGREISTLIKRQMKAGYHSVNWNASNYSSGVYFYRIEAGDFKQDKKMLLLK